jgi:hypothetical protein
MANELFVLALAMFCALLLRWGFRALPQERWQIIASIPLSKEDSEHWRGVNLTYYGFFTANGVVVAVIIYFILMGAIQTPLQASLVVAGATLLVGIFGSKAVARKVEKKMHTSTVAGASFLALLAFPGLIWLANKVLGSRWGLQIPILPSLAAAATAFALGGGIGRLACISFGCCYGKPLSHLPPILRTLFGRWSLTFFGKTKKIAYEGGLEKEKVVPTQAITYLVFVLAGLLSILFFLRSLYAISFVLSMGVTQGWRAISESLRADYRGSGKIPAYQGMALLMILYSLGIAPLLPASPVPSPDILAGIQVLWNPAVILFLEALWLSVFLYYGRSAVTASSISFHVLRDRI